MHDTNELCRKIKEIYPEIGQCGVNVNISLENDLNTYVVHLEKGEHKLDTYLEKTEADECMEGKQCVHLGVDIAQLVDRIDEV